MALRFNGVIYPTVGTLPLPAIQHKISQAKTPPKPETTLYCVAFLLDSQERFSYTFFRKAIGEVNGRPICWKLTGSTDGQRQEVSQMERLTLDIASRIVDKALEKGKKMGFVPLTAVVLDTGGQMVVLKREDNSSLLRPEIAMGKAWGVLGMGFGGRELARRAAIAPAFFNALSDMSGGRMVPNPGGVLIRSESGAILGSVGISGDTSENDEICAVYGIESVGLKPDTGD
jgi:uncharacterized protein GlcG (DUF336 family)